jgi:hypothetical protein
LVAEGCVFFFERFDLRGETLQTAVQENPESAHRQKRKDVHGFSRHRLLPGEVAAFYQTFLARLRISTLDIYS